MHFLENMFLAYRIMVLSVLLVYTLNLFFTKNHCEIKSIVGAWTGRGVCLYLINRTKLSMELGGVTTIVYIINLL